MKYVALAGALAFTLCAGVCEAEDGKAKDASGNTAVTQETSSSKGLKHIDLGEDDYERPVTQMGTMSEGQSYGDNTGFPNTVESDSDMNLQ